MRSQRSWFHHDYDISQPLFSVFILDKHRLCKSIRLFKARKKGSNDWRCPMRNLTPLLRSTRVKVDHKLPKNIKFTHQTETQGTKN